MVRRTLSATVVVLLVVALLVGRPGRAYAWGASAAVLPAAAIAAGGAGAGVISGAAATAPALLATPGSAVAAAGTAGVAAGVVLPAAIVVGGAAVIFLGARWALTGSAPWQWGEAGDPAVALTEADGMVATIPGWGLSGLSASQSGTGTVIRPTGQTWSRVIKCTNQSGQYGGSFGPGASFSWSCQAGNTLEYVCIGVLQTPCGDGYPGNPVRAYWRADAVGDPVPAWGGDPGAEARVRVTAQCRSSSGVRSVTVDSPAYGPSDPLPAIPEVECEAGERLDEYRVDRVVPGTDVPDVPLIEPMVIPQPEVYPEWLDPADWDAWDECIIMIPEPCPLEVVERDAEGNPDPERILAPPLGWGWWLHPDRESLYACMWGSIVLPLEECAALAWERDPVTGEWRTRPPEEGVQSLPDSTPDGQPEGTPGGEGCMARDVEEGSGWMSRWIFRGVRCALEWAFVPSAETMARLQSVPDVVTSRTPFAQIAAVGDIADAVRQGEQSCWDIRVSMPEQWPFGDVEILDTCDVEHPIVARMIQLRPLLTVMIYLVLFLPLGWWAWRTYAPASTSSA